ncbi:hypothetical protein F2P81_005326 [Scophthalmus maximus]|uniref:Uncharacterized protein n=1 Tax=Scophthalmus maximus TaxID=52904 RepID=A0A6A4TEZ1_SCOMX|nr:hypothetical protein F2P81_005326 [Scophthalmus maximus]
MSLQRMALVSEHAVQGLERARRLTPSPPSASRSRCRRKKKSIHSKTINRSGSRRNRRVTRVQAPPDLQASRLQQILFGLPIAEKHLQDANVNKLPAAAAADDDDSSTTSSVDGKGLGTSEGCDSAATPRSASGEVK